MAINEIFDDKIGLAAGRQRIAGTFEQFLRFVKRKLQAEREREDGFFRWMIMFIIFDFGKMGFRDVRAMVEIGIPDALFSDELEKHLAEAGLEHLLDAREKRGPRIVGEAAVSERIKRGDGGSCGDDGGKGERQRQRRGFFRDIMRFQIAADVLEKGLSFVWSHGHAPRWIFRP